jgi:hypothetical protein
MKFPAVSLRILLLLLAFLLAAYCLRPATQPPQVALAGHEPFAWERDELFTKLENEFLNAHKLSDEEAAFVFAGLMEEGQGLLERINSASDYTQPLEGLESVIFRMGAIAASNQSFSENFQLFIYKAQAVARGHLKNADEDSFQLLYRILYGGRTALDEALVQVGEESLPSLYDFKAQSRRIPSAEIRGVLVQSGDIALSRGGAPTSALISRGSDFPGNFSHAALIHVDESTGTVSVIESLIEKGVVVSSLKEYLEDKKLRVMLLRLDPALTPEASQLPHQAASVMLERARAERIPYDFKMDWEESSALFCSEVPHYAFRAVGVELWSFKSPMSSEGLVSWLAALGVRRSTTLMPSALEYDWKLIPVAEWRNLETLLYDRMDNAVLDALLDEAERGLRLDFAWWKLPLARLAKGYSVVAAWFGSYPPIPKRLTPEQALSVDSLNKYLFPAVRVRLETLAAEWEKEYGYKPPYWRLYQMAALSIKELTAT